ncbi:hypothetical protein HYALB_00008204 [Hymenoscyphus albidus]|uniref:Methyltransferase domain-containing protein n=1 Tax=Hymenoscyphus albidus TaxID=595503 RepID=A0A9N9LTN5_9HELO|nr:hypothetical protein HYALB_00008204 [Hymenoscyphus albidus]
MSDRSRFTFQNNWFELITPDWEKLTTNLGISKPLRILEIGAFEGASTTWILDNLANHPNSTMTVIDTFSGGMEHDPQGTKSLEERFYDNVQKCTNVTKLKVLKAKSEDALVNLRASGAQFDFIYIDGSHVAIDVLHDAVLCWHMLALDGTMVFDDWTWKGYYEHFYNPRMAIMGFLQCVEPEVKTEETESQIWVTRVSNETVPTKNEDPSLMYWDRNERFMVSGM